MALKDDIALLKQAPIFADLSEDHLRLLAFGAERRRLDVGQVLFREGASADSAFVVAAGRLKLTKTKPGRLDDRPVGDAGPGYILTEIAMIGDADRHFTATAIEPSEVIRISRLLFHRMLEEYPEVAVIADQRLRENFSELARSVSDAVRKLV